MKPIIAESSFEEIFGLSSASIFRFFAPGRVNLIGEHIDYNGGKVLPAALSVGIEAAVRIRNDRSVLIGSNGKSGIHKFKPAADWKFDKSYEWANLPAGVLTLLLRKGIELPGLEIYLHSTLPEGSGLSSSAAVAVLTAWIGLHMSGMQPDPLLCARTAQQAEIEFLGLNCGIMDPFAVAFGKAGQAIHLDCEGLEYEYVPAKFPGFQFVILDSAIPRTLADSAYNTRRASCEKAAELLGVKLLAHIEDPGQVDQICDETIRRRARHVVTECLRVEQAVISLRAGDAQRFGALLNASHESLSSDYQVSTPEVDMLMSIANSHPSCLGARITGAGFGGCAIALVKAQMVDDFRRITEQHYLRYSGRNCTVFPAKIGSGVYSF